MLPEQKDLVFKHFPQIVQECDLEKTLLMLTKKGEVTQDMVEEIMKDASSEEDTKHNNRCILFKMLEYDKSNIFPVLIKGLQETGFHYLADTLENKFVTAISNLNPLDVKVNVKFSSKFYDSEKYNNTSFYTTRSRNRGHVLIINNIKFNDNVNKERIGAMSDGQKLKALFEEMGLTVIPHTNLSAYDMHIKTQEFLKMSTQATRPDMGIIIVMSHGVVYNNETLIIGSDNKFIPEDYFKSMLNNEKCALFRKKPKILIHHICRTVLQNPVDRETLTESDLSFVPKRTYSDMLICHPSVKGFTAHRNQLNGSWYIQLLCKVFMNFACEMDIESLLKKVDEELETVSSIPWKMDDGSYSTEQTSTFQNIAFKKCYIHPGIYEENGEIISFSQSK